MEGQKRNGGIRVYDRPKNAGNSLPMWAVLLIIILGIVSTGFTLYWVFA